MFAVSQVDARTAEAIEPLGTKSKFWYRDGGRKMLFKAEARGTGEDWAEKLACELCALLGLPHVHYELAFETETQLPGVICESCTPPPLELAHGNQLLLAIDPDYPAGERGYRVRSHTIDAVFGIVEVLEPPPERWRSRTPANIRTAADVFVGYLMLDAWIANQDRHHENWAAIWDGNRLALAPTFDHGACLARNLSDDERRERLTSKDRNRRVPHFARRARSAFHDVDPEGRALSTVAAWMEFARRVPEAASTWLETLAALKPDELTGLLRRVPPDRLSAVGSEFTLHLLEENKERLLAPHPE